MAINIGIIGGGPTGISMVIHLFRTISNANIILFDINETPSIRAPKVYY